VKLVLRAACAALAAATILCPVDGLTSGELAFAAQPPAEPGTTVIIGGRRIRVTAQLSLDPASPIPEGPGVQLNASVGIRTDDPRGLPTGLALRSFRALAPRATWGSRLLAYATFAYDPATQGGEASGGPAWPQGTRTNVIVEMTRAGRTHRVTVRNVFVGRLP